MNVRLDLNIPDHLDITPERVHLGLAIGLYVDRQVSLGKAAEIAGMDVLSFQQELSKRDIRHHYDTEDLETDLLTLQSLKRL